LKNLTFLFKVGCESGSSSRFEPSYRVKAFTGESDLMDQWKKIGKAEVKFFRMFNLTL